LTIGEIPADAQWGGDAIGWIGAKAMRLWCQECDRRATLLIAALELIEPEHVTKLGQQAKGSFFDHARRHGGMVWYGRPEWPSMAYIDPVAWFE
jgi:hypothetical protein